MKPSKKQINPSATKNQIKEKSVQGIQTFFKATPKTFTVDENVVAPKPIDDPKKFFVNILKEKLRHGRDVDNVARDENKNLTDRAATMEEANGNRILASEIQIEPRCLGPKTPIKCDGCIQKSLESEQWQQKYHSEVERRKQLKKVYVSLNIQFSELYSKHNDLLKAVTHRQCVDDAASSSTSSVDVFTPAEKKFLQCIELLKTSDCTFIHNCLKYAYKSNQSVLVSKTLKGTAEKTEITPDGEEIHHEAKSPLTPEKVQQIKNLFVERISKCQIDSVDYKERMKEPYVNKLIAAGIKNLSKKFK